MGQYWVVVNIDKRQILHEIGKLGVSLFNGTFDDIECHLQRFEASYRNPEVIVVAHWDKNETASEDKHVFQGERTKWEIKSISAPLSHSTLGAFRKVPNEIIYYILEQVIDIVDVIMFSLTNTNMYFPGYKVIQRRYIEAANWEGDRIICIGDNSYWMELPPNSFTKPELERIYTEYGLDFNLELESQDENEDIQDEYYALGVSRDPLARNLETRWSTPYHYVLETFDQPRSNYGLRSSARQAVERRLERSGPIFRQNIFPLTTACFDSRAPQCPPDKPDLLLCNISKRVYVNIPRIVDLGVDCLSWAALLGSKICWSSDDNCSTQYKGNDLYRGEWVGDTFACRRVDQLHELGGEGEWKDVTAKELERIQKIWEY